MKFLQLKKLKRNGIILAMLMIFMTCGMNASASENLSKAVYDTEKGGTQYFVICSEDGLTSEIMVEELEENFRIANGKYKVSYKNTGAWEAGFYVEISGNKIAKAYSPFHSVATGSILAPKLVRNNEEKVTYSFIYQQAAMNYSTGVVARMSGTDLLVEQK